MQNDQTNSALSEARSGSWKNVALLGDSVFDNSAYTQGRPAVVDHLENLLFPSGTATLFAVDGAVTKQVIGQIKKIPKGTSQLIISSGGNDALQNIDLLSAEVSSVAEALDQFRAPIAFFQQDFETLLEQIAETNIPAWCCSIYNGRINPPLHTVAPVAIRLFNDVIFSTASSFSIPVIDLRKVCTATKDFTNQIEPSAVGGEKIAKAILNAIQ